MHTCFCFCVHQCVGRKELYFKYKNIQITHTNAHTQTHTHTHILCARVYIYVCVCVCAYISMCVCVCVPVCVRVCSCVCTYLCICVPMRTDLIFLRFPREENYNVAYFVSCISLKEVEAYYIIAALWRPLCISAGRRQ